MQTNILDKLFPLDEVPERMYGRAMPKDVTPGLVSVIIPTYNRANLVGQAIQSVCDQTYRPIEVLVVDDGSSDDTAKQLEAWQDRVTPLDGIELQWFYQDNAGAPSARNHGMMKARGEFLQFLDSDCTMHPHKLNRQVECLRSPNIGYCSCATHFVTLNGETVSSIGSYPSDDILLDAVSTNMTCIAPLWKRAAIGAITWDEDLTCLEDWVFKLRVLANGVTGSYIAEPLCSAYLHEGERISDHRSRNFIIGQEKAMMRAESIVRPLNGSEKALNLLGLNFLSSYKSYIRLQEFHRAGFALRRAISLVTTWNLKLQAVRFLHIYLGPKYINLLLRFIGRL